MPRTALSFWPFSTTESPVGSAQWWKKHKAEAVFVQGKGYQVPGVDGYFDGDGRPMKGPVSTERVIEAGEVRNDTGLIPALDPRVGYDKVKTAVGLGPNEQIARQDYTAGDQLFREKKYKAAAEKFSAAVSRGPHSSIHQDAMFMLAESYFFDDRYIKARDSYDALVKAYSNTRYLDQVIDREWKIARYWEQYDQHYPHYSLTPNVWDKTRPWFDTLGHAIKTYDSIRLNDPTGPRADDAIMATANIYFEQGRYDDADYHYTLLRREYPRSEFQFEAHLLGLRAKLGKYQGEDYDGTPLEEAKKLVKELNSQYADRLNPQDKKRLVQTEAEVNREIANRDYRMAAYYDKKKDYGAARLYYAEVIKKYPDTELAKISRDRVAKIEGEPASPAKPLGFIVDHLPESRERARVARIPELQHGDTRLAAAPDSGDTKIGSAAPETTTK
ncbi:MAG TPA: outer membrane protein assembly factor BamD [Lacipirellulaceae bacterium]|nr:outer membrane protein assembly factor BamD [Lacipirellulaceae bacterium]